MMIYLFTEHPKDIIHYYSHHYYNSNDNAYYYVVLLNFKLGTSYYKGDILPDNTGIWYNKCKEFEYTVPENITIFSPTYNHKTNNFEVLQDLERFKLEIILNNI